MVWKSGNGRGGLLDYLRKTARASFELNDQNECEQFEVSTYYCSSVQLQTYDPFDVRPVDEIVADAKAKAQAAIDAQQAREDMEFFGGGAYATARENGEGTSSPEPDEAADRPAGFEDEFRVKQVRMGI